MSYLKNMSPLPYSFGNNEKAVNFPDLSRYSSVVDQVADATTAYQQYTILENMRPDQVSYQLYGRTDFYWTFFLMNDKLREQGWPLSQAELLTRCQKDYTGTALVTASDLVSDQTTGTGAIRDKIAEGVTLVGQTSGVTAVVDHIQYELGQVIVKGTKSFTEGEFVYLSTDINVGFTATTVVAEHLATHHWENASGEYVDLVNASTGIVDITGGAQNTKVTNLGRYIKQNDNLKTIKVLRQGVAESVVDLLISAIGE